MLHHPAIVRLDGNQRALSLKDARRLKYRGLQVRYPHEDILKEDQIERAGCERKAHTVPADGIDCAGCSEDLRGDVEADHVTARTALQFCGYDTMSAAGLQDAITQTYSRTAQGPRTRPGQPFGDCG